MTQLSSGCPFRPFFGCADIVSYTEVASKLTPLQVVRLLNELYTQFDRLCDKHGCYKVEVGARRCA
jgi:class 3 adenylate cyclase